MFYVAVAFEVAVFGLGFVLLPGWWKLAWIGGFLLTLMVLPLALARVLDPLNAARIRAYCARIGVTDVRVEVFPNHYGVHFRKNDKDLYAKCQVKGWQIKWKDLSPSEVQ